MDLWLEDLRSEFDRAFLVDWSQHIRQLNVDLKLSGSDLLVETPRPPEFFWGDLEALQPSQWVAVVSLNPQVYSAKDEAWYQQQDWTPQAYWDYLNRRDLKGFREADYYYTRFARPLVKLAGPALGIVDPVSDEVTILMRRMALFEILPYASRTYVPRPDIASSLVVSDMGCAIAQQAALGAIKHRRPAAVLINGSDAVHVFAAVHQVVWTEQRYPSESNAPKSLRHWEAAYESDTGTVPVFGFPQLRGQSSHNSDVEIQQLASRIAEVVRGRGA